MNRRGVFAAAVGVAAAAAGLALALRRGTEAEPLDSAFWAQRFPGLGGAETALAAFRGRPLMLNFWATWCAPCVTEMPLLAAFARQHPGWQVVGVAVDREEPVRRFVTERHIPFPILLADGRGPALARTLGNSAGGLPFTVVFDPSGQARERRLGALDSTLLTRWNDRYGGSSG